MIRRGARPPLVSQITGLPNQGLRTLWSDVYGSKPPQGLLPNNSLGLLKRYRHVLHANLFFLNYAHHGQSIYEGVDAQKVLMSYDSYIKCLTLSNVVPELDFSACFYVARDIWHRVLEKRFCRLCKINHIYSFHQNSLHDCPFCEIHTKQNAHRLAPRSKTTKQPK